MGRACAVFGNNTFLEDIPQFETDLKKVIVSLIEKDIDLFVLSDSCYFCSFVTGIINELQKEYPHVEIWGLNNYDLHYPQKHILWVDEINPSFVKRPKQGISLTRLEKYIVDEIDCVLCYIDDDKDPYYNALRYARLKNKTIVNMGKWNINMH